MTFLDWIVPIAISVSPLIPIPLPLKSIFVRRKPRPRGHSEVHARNLNKQKSSRYTTDVPAENKSSGNYDWN